MVIQPLKLQVTQHLFLHWVTPAAPHSPAPPSVAGSVRKCQRGTLLSRAPLHWGLPSTAERSSPPDFWRGAMFRLGVGQRGQGPQFPSLKRWSSRQARLAQAPCQEHLFHPVLLSPCHHSSRVFSRRPKRPLGKSSSFVDQRVELKGRGL